MFLKMAKLSLPTSLYKSLLKPYSSSPAVLVSGKWYVSWPIPVGSLNVRVVFRPKFDALSGYTIRLRISKGPGGQYGSFGHFWTLFPGLVSGKWYVSQAIPVRSLNVRVVFRPKFDALSGYNIRCKISKGPGGETGLFTL